MSKTEGVEGGKVWKYKKQSKIEESPLTYLVCLVIIIPFFAFLCHSLTKYHFSPAVSSVPEALLVVVIGLISLGTIIIGVAFFTTFVCEQIIGVVRRFKPNRSHNILISSWVPLIAYFLVIPVSLIWGIGENPTAPSNNNPDEEIKQAYLDEYGYSEIDYPFEAPKEAVKDAEGNEIIVRVVTYSNQIILFDSPEQLAEKIKKVDSGTYLKGDNNE